MAVYVGNILQLIWTIITSHTQYQATTELPMDLFISKLIPPYCLVWHSSNKAVSLSLKRHRPGSITDITSQVYHANSCGFAGSPLILAPCIFILVTACMFQFVGSVFLYSFKTSQTFASGQGSGTFLAKGAMKPTYFELYFCESHIIFFNT